MCCDGFGKHWIAIPSMQHIVWQSQGHLQGKQKCGLRYVKTAIFCTCGSNNWETVEDRWVRAARGLASTKLSFHSCNVLRDCPRGVPRANKKWRPGYVKMTIFCNCGSNNYPCNILRDNRKGISRRNKNVGCGTWKRRFFALVVRMTEKKLLKTDGYMLRGVWQALNCLFIHATFCVIAAGASPGQTKNEGLGT